MNRIGKDEGSNFMNSIKKKLRYFVTILLVFNSCTSCFSQLTEIEEELIAPSLSISPKLDYIIEANIRGVSSTGEHLPFWLEHNQRGRISGHSNFSTWLTGKTVWFLSENAFLLTGTSILYQDDSKDGVVPDELFVHFQNSWLYLTAGRKQKPELYHGLSASNENILWSLNARPLPGIQLGTSAPLLLFGDWGPGFEFSWNEYVLGKERKIQNPHLHHKSLYLVYRAQERLQIKVGAQHFSHWGGEMADGSPVPDELANYWEAVTLKNVQQTHMTSYEAYVDYTFRDFSMRFLYNQFATDRSGRLYENAPDGRYGLYFEKKEKDNLINRAIYEFYYTKNQSKDSQSKYYDNYFNFYEYGEGWSYLQQFLGVPFFTYNSEAGRVTGNNFIAHHLGIGGQLNIPFETNPYKLLFSYVKNSGTYRTPLVPAQNNIYTFFEMGIIQNPVKINVQFSSETSNTSSPVIGFGLLVNYRL